MVLLIDAGSSARKVSNKNTLSVQKVEQHPRAPALQSDLFRQIPTHVSLNLSTIQAKDPYYVTG